MTLLTLPHELVERILLLLDTKSVLTCRLFNRQLNAIIQSSTVLQYLQACEAAGVIDNPRSPLSYAERLEALGKREDAWRKLEPVFETTIKGNHLPLTMSYFTGGAYFINNNDLHYCHLPSSPQDKPRWSRIPAHGPEQNRSGFIVDIGIAVYEHDLVVNVISSEVENQAADMQRHSLDLVLLKLSTGEYHPLARHPRIHVQRSSSPRPWITVEIVGDNLALVVPSEDGMRRDNLFIFNWKTGYKRLQHEAAESAYSDLVFVSPELLLVPNLVLSHFEVWHLPPEHLNSEPPVQILSLQIPTISHDYFFSSFSCSGEPNHRRASYTLIMHRRALLDTMQKWTSTLLLEQHDLAVWLTNKVTVHKIADLDDGSVRLVAQSKLDPIWSCPRTRGSPTYATSQSSPNSPIFHISADSGSSSVSSGSSTSTLTSRYNFLQVQWVDWGPPISRWFQVNEAQAYLMATVTGQRYPFSVPNPRDRRKLMVSVADFNLHNLRRNAETVAQPSGETEDSGSNGKNEGGKEEGKEDEWELLDHEGVFSEEVYMGLKCVVYPAPPGEYDFDGVLIDEERLLGLKLDRDGTIESVKVLYIG
ncbi:hypothetical protein M378DRAFT_164920 [Amanita muscaria Koide BX008]|uniref:F-box domain-containing protein n=1 Tax=Amanita muscaria (strain Koide BX008) TaxID=946122 RepID=A0A0C2T8U3_AMAMK|nr:hypothetical protein M378DRAFT_164920 [Amanita muscaria Koide BX008]